MKHISTLLRTANIIALSCLMLFSCNLHSQEVSVDYTADSLRVVNAEWSTDTLDGCLLRHYHFGEGQLFCAAQHIFLIELPPDSPRQLVFVCDSATAEVSQFAARANALAAINGSYFDMATGYPICYLRIDGREWGENTPQKTDSINRKYYQHAAIALAGGRPRLIVPDSNRTWESSLPDSNIMTAGPMLLCGGKMVPQRDDRTFVTKRHNRTAIGIRPDGTTIILVADGRFKHQAEGFSLPELERVMLWLGCVDAINLDGGGSSTLFVRDYPADGVVNYPSDNNRHDHLGARPVSNAILIL